MALALRVRASSSVTGYVAIAGRARADRTAATNRRSSARYRPRRAASHGVTLRPENSYSMLPSAHDSSTTTSGWNRASASAQFRSHLGGEIRMSSVRV